ncbi:MAG TPA: bifunctional diguanylate cyclase/phosphodiesterase [Actinomycetota bacterium]
MTPHISSRAWRLVAAAAIAVTVAVAVVAIVRGNTASAIGLTALGGAVGFVILVRLSGPLVDFEKQRRMATEMTRLKAALEDQATHDFLTELPNRRLLRDRLEQALAIEDRRPGCLLLDLDNFKSINDVHGHSVGDELLVAVARRLQNAVRAKDVVGRLGGDEFFIVFEHTGPDEAAALANRFLGALERPIAVGSRQILAQASVGIAIGAGGLSEEELLKQADIAMYESKRRGGNGWTLFDSSLETATRSKHQLEMDLRLAVRNNEMRLHYQPVIDLTTGEMVGVEALVRWEHPDFGLVSPDRFIPIAEATGDIDAIGSWVLNEAIRQVLDWDRRFGTALDVAINLSPVQLEREGSIEAIASNLGKAGIRPERVTLEITESAVMKDPERMIGVLTSLKTSGFQIAVDDFGTGYSSLSYLRKLPVDIVKIDKSFVAGIASETEEFALASLIVELTHSLGKTSLAEGIERTEHLAHLRAMNCKLGQGYYFSRPLPPEKLELLLVMPVTSWPQSA